MTTMTQRYLTRQEMADKLGITLSTLRTYEERGAIPEAEVIVGVIPGWAPETVEELRRARASAKRKRALAATRKQKAAENNG